MFQKWFDLAVVGGDALFPDSGRKNKDVIDDDDKRLEKAGKAARFKISCVMNS